MEALLAQDPMLPRRYRVKRVWKELGDVASLELEPIDGEPVPFQPGQFNMLYAFGVGEVAISISGDPADGSGLVHTIRNVGAVSAALTKVSDGDVIGVRGPFGTAWPVAQETGRNIVFVAGGLGLAPLRPAIYHVLQNRAHYSGLTLIYGARSPDDLLYAEEIKSWKSRFDTEVEITVDHAAPGWTGQVGVVTIGLDKALAGIDKAEVSAFLCGPEIMMRFSVMSLTAAGVPEERIWVSMERNMKCAVGFCGHCQFGPDFICRDGPVFRHDQVSRLISKKEV
ncbi:FAD/NAD(P)-binding protein [Roseibium aggregatum]|nr:FAD/NAD(P)-binding protein [Roseibium aggregatum]